MITSITNPSCHAENRQKISELGEVIREKKKKDGGSRSGGNSQLNSKYTKTSNVYHNLNCNDPAKVQYLFKKNKKVLLEKA
jgi:hypothetical protein